MAEVAKQQDYVALEWVKGEIGQTLKQTQQALEAFAENPSDSTQLRFCLAHLYQVKGSLQMVEAHALVPLAAEMEALIQALQSDSVADGQEALQMLMQAVLQLPIWLEQLAGGYDDLSALSLPLRNHLRAVRGEPLLQEASLQALECPEPLSELSQTVLLERASNNFDELLHRMRQALQKALPGIVRGQDMPTNLDYLFRVFSRLAQLCQQAPLYPLWKIAAVLVEALKSGALSATPSLHILLRKLDHELKLLTQRGIAGINQRPPEDLLSGLLLQVARARADLPSLAALKAEYGLDAVQAAPPMDSAEAQLTRASPDALGAVVSALCEDLMWVKDELDLFVRSQNDNLSVLGNLLLPLKRVEGTLSVLGFTQAQKTIRVQIGTLHGLTQGQQAADYGLLLDMAGALLYVESSLTGMVALNKGGLQRPHEMINLPQTQQLVLQEAHLLLGQVKDAFIEFIGDNWKSEHLQAVPELLSEVSGALHLASFDRASRVLAVCNRYVQEQLLASGQTPPDWQSLDRLADAISGIEYYLERLRIDPPDQGAALLTLAEQSLQALGYPLVTALAAAKPIGQETAEQSKPAHTAQDGNREELSKPLELDNGSPEPKDERLDNSRTQSPPSEQKSALIVLDKDTPPSLSEETEAPLASNRPALSIGEVLAEPVTPINPPAAESPLSLLPPADDEEPLDDELLEVFVEELDEVRDVLNEFLPRWQKAPDDHALQGEIRRAFHTLKGSGRMVRALVIGELAWAVENLLNRVLDGSRKVDEDVLSLVLEVIALLPGLRDEFASQRQRQRDDVDRLATLAHALAKGSLPIATEPSIERASASLEPLDASATDGQAESRAVVAPEFVEPGEAIKTDQENLSASAEPPEQASKDEQTDAWLEMALADFEWPEQQTPPVIESPEEELLSPSAPLFEQPTGESKASEDAPKDPLSDNEQARLDKGLLAVFHQEAKVHLATLAEFLKNCVDRLPQPVTDALQTALHTLKGSAHMAGVLPIVRIAAPLGKLLELLKSHDLAVDLAEADLLGRGGSMLHQALLQLDPSPLREIPGSRELLRDIAKLQEQRLNALQLLQRTDSSGAALDAQRSLFLAEGMDLLLEAGVLLEQWRDNGSVPSDFEMLLSQLAELADTARSISLSAFEMLCRALLTLYQAAVDGQIAASEAFFNEAQKTHELLLSMLDKLVALMEVSAEPEQIATLQALLPSSAITARPEEGAERDEQILSTPLPEAELTALLDGEPEVHQVKEDQASLVCAEILGEAAKTSTGTAVKVSASDDELDEELFAIFFEEGSEILQRAGDSLQRWMEQPQSREELPGLQRELHTLKGSARATGFFDMGHLAHALEFLYEDLAAEKLQTDPELLELLQRGHDCLAVMLEALQVGATLPDAGDLIRDMARLRGAEEPAQSLAPAVFTASEEVAEVKDSTLPTALSLEKNTSQSQLAINAAPSAELQSRRSDEDSSKASASSGKVLPFIRREKIKNTVPEGQEQVRIAASKLDSFSNLAGEISIFRARIEQQIGDFGSVLNEMESTIERLRWQLRQLDIETQAQTLSSYQAAGQDDENFDPLEMDRHSQLQQLARSLFESATDLLDLKQALSSHSRDAETLLLQQARTSSELQESLMYIRLVRFERVVPRLSRIVRQLSRELGKKVELSVENAHSEMDRALLERLNAPLEHMLRNAIDHGIENASERLAAGKPEAGQIHLQLEREGGDILLTLQDDGRGINLEAVRRKAIERGLTDADAKLSAQEIQQFVLEAGFSTAPQVSQTSGRGIGMDVVQSEIRRAGGSLTIDSAQGQGTRFTIRLPFTVSVSRALMVRSGDDLYALALATVEGVVRLSADELSRQYSKSSPSLNYVGQRYTLHYLGDLLGNGQKPKLASQSLPLPLILFKSGEQRLAVQVDALIGAREIVVKGLGSQFGRVPGISGATILGDGRVVVILDLPALMRKHQRGALSVDDTKPVAVDDERPLLVMVVDDSITVRKVTGRLLERHGMNVLTAKDGVEAIALLQEHQPDLMLLDIEMPRMDGFEVAALVRHNEALKDLPIIMITSRTGAKHRERGLSLGVNDYLGKPYQEAQLLGRIEQLTYRSRHV